MTGKADESPRKVLRPVSYRGVSFFIVDGVEHRIDGHFHIDFDPAALHDALDITLEHTGGTQVVDASVDLTLNLRVVPLMNPIRCDECGDQFRQQDLQKQIEGYLRRRFSRQRLTDSVREKIVDSVQPWWGRFIAGEDICFRCGVSAGRNSTTR